MLTKRHLKSTMTDSKFKCEPCCYNTDCSTSFSGHCTTTRHKLLHPTTEFMCDCGKYFHSDKALTYHVNKCDAVPLQKQEQVQPVDNQPTPEQQQINAQAKLVLQIIDSVSTNIHHNPPPSSPDMVNDNLELKRQVAELTKQNNDHVAHIATMCKLLDSSLMGCAFCEEKSRLLEYHSDQYGQHSICKECVLKSTGYSSIRPEIIMREFLRSRYNKPMLRANQWIKGEACTKYRPDTMYADPNRVLTVECDESQHTGKSYLCEDKRVSEMYDEYPGKTAIWIRFNSGSCSHPDSANKSMDVRLEELLDLMRAIETMEFDTMIHVFYMYYSPENPNITNQFSKTMIN